MKYSLLIQKNEGIVESVVVWRPEGKIRVFDLSKDYEECKTFLEKKSREFITHDALSLWYDLYREFRFLPKLVGDTRILELLAQEHFGIEDMGLDLAGRAESIYQLHETKVKEVVEYKGIYKLELELVGVLVQIRSRGLVVNKERFLEEVGKLEDELNGQKKELFLLAGKEFALQSRKEIVPILFDEMKLPQPPVTTKSGNISLSAEALAYLGEVPFVKKLVRARHNQSALSMRRDIDNNIEGGIVHPEFRPIGESASSRIYTSKPAVNQMPEELRRAVIPGIGKKFWLLDWVGAELIYMAILAGQKDLIELYKRGGDPHRFVASIVLGIPEEEIKEEQREVSKVITFSIVFGSEGDAAARKMRVTREEAAGWVATFLSRFHQINLYMKKNREEGEENGCVFTWLGRRRILFKLQSQLKSVRKEGLRQSQNTPVQSGVADLLKWALVRIDKGLSECVIRFMVFDSILLEVEEDAEIEDFRKRLDKVFTFSKGGQTIKFRYKIKEGISWGDMMR